MIRINYKLIGWWKAGLLAFLFLFPVKIYALLSPYYQSVAEITRIFQDPNLAAKLGSQAIYSITHVKGEAKTGWEFVYGANNECKLFVNVKYLPAKEPGFVGPAIFALEVEESVCKIAPENKLDHPQRN